MMRRYVDILSLSERGDHVALALIDALTRPNRSGFDVRLSTDPIQLAATARGSESARVLILDTLDSAAYDVLQLISVLGARRRTGVMVAVRNPAQRRRARQAGADACLDVPIDRHAVLDHVTALMDRYGRRPGAPGHIVTRARAPMASPSVRQETLDRAGRPRTPLSQDALQRAG